MEAHEFSMSVHDLDAAGKQYSFPVRPAWLRGALEGTEVTASGPDGELDVRISKSGTDVVVRGSLKAELQVACARCLEPARVVVNESLSALAVPGSVDSKGRRTRGGAGGEAGGADDDEEAADGSAELADLIPYDGETVVLDDLVRDELLLAIPMIPLCSESCPGIRPEISPDSPAAEGVDPRLRALLRLKRTL